MDRKKHIITTRFRKRIETHHSQNREIAVVSNIFFLLFLAVMIYFVVFEIQLGGEFMNSQNNTLQDLMAQYVVRGSIISADGQILAETDVAEDGTETRVYPYGRVFAHAVGYSVNGKLGLENQANFKLLKSHQFFVTRIINDLSHEKSIGDNAYTTLRTDLQQAAYDGLGDYKGAVIALDPSTGAILAMVSKPDFDPNTVAQNWDLINSAGSTVLYNRATQGQYAPGSTFKIFTLLEYYRENRDSFTSYTYTCDGEITEDGETIHCAGKQAHGEETLMESFANSCNCSFANISLSLDTDSFRKTCESLFFNTRVPSAFTVSRNIFDLNSKADAGLVMRTGIGQGDTLVTPLYLAMISGTICNDGVMMRPYLLDHMENADGVEVSRTGTRSCGKLLSEDEVSFLQTYMQAVIEEGTAAQLATDQYEVYGKTGSAQLTDSLSNTNAWFTGYARKDGKTIAVAVLVENAGSGSRYAVPLAKEIFDIYFSE